MSDFDTGGEPLEDEQFNDLLATLEDRLIAEETLVDFEREAGIYLHGFIRRLVVPALTPEQTEKTLAYFKLLAERHPGHGAMIWQERELLKKYAGANHKAMLNFLPFSKANSWFRDTETLDTHGELFADDAIGGLAEMLEAVLEMPETVANFAFEANIHLSLFINQLQYGNLTPAQTVRIVAYLNDLGARYPDLDAAMERHIFRLENLTPGQTALNIAGNDLDGVEFELNDYRGNIVVLYFSGHWCAPCRGEYPYQRFMLELFKNDPVTILGVNSDEDPDIVREAKQEQGLDYRVWWDGHGEKPTKGPIATAWNVRFWPAIFILDDNGVIRYSQERGGEVITAVNQLLEEKRMRDGIGFSE